MPQPIPDTRPVLFVCIGASNLARGYGYLAARLRQELRTQPVEFLTALGPGRNYCVRGGVFCITYPAICDCGIFEAARERAGQAARVIALVTDIGNDIMSGIPAETIIARLNGIFDKLNALDAHIVATTLPVHLETELNNAAFVCLRTLLYPKSQVTHAQAVAAIRRINEFLKISGRELLDHAGKISAEMARVKAEGENRWKSIYLKEIKD